MATRCEIAIINKNKCVTSVYSHFDGYPSYMGRILYEDCKTETDVIKFMQHSFYDIIKYDDINNYLNKTNNVDYIYIFNKNKWYYVNNYKSKNILPLTKKLIYDEELIK